MIQRYLIIHMLVVVAFPVMAQNSLPANAEHLRQFLSDEKSLVDAARQYHLQQIDLTQWDYEVTQKNSESTDSALLDLPQESLEKRIENIRMVWEYVLSVYPNNVRAMNYFGEYWYDMGGNAAAALTYWKRALVVDNKMSFAHNNIGIHYFHTGDYRNGLEHIESAVELEPKNPDFLYNITQMYLNHFPAIMKLKGMDKKKLYRTAMKHSKNATRYAPDDFSLAQDYAVNFFAGENFGVDVDWEEAAAAWQVTQLLAENEQHTFYSILNEGRCWILAGEPEKALPLFKTSLTMRPDSAIVTELISKTQTDLVNQ